MNKTEKLLVVLTVLVGLLVVIEVGERVPWLSGAIPVESSGGLSPEKASKDAPAGTTVESGEGLSREEAYRAAHKACMGTVTEWDIGEELRPLFCYGLIDKGSAIDLRRYINRSN